MTETLYDFAVIGAGMAGASIAAELSPYAKVANHLTNQITTF